MLRSKVRECDLQGREWGHWWSSRVCYPILQFWWLVVGFDLLESCWHVEGFYLLGEPLLPPQWRKIGHSTAIVGIWGGPGNECSLCLAGH